MTDNRGHALYYKYLTELATVLSQHDIGYAELSKCFKNIEAIVYDIKATERSSFPGYTKKMWG